MDNNNASLDDLLLSGNAILCNAYSGLGDALILGPIVQALAMSAKGYIYYPDNPVLDFYKNLGIKGLDRVLPMPSDGRRFVNKVSKQQSQWLKDCGIAGIVNFRRDVEQYKERYIAAADDLKNKGFWVTDICTETDPVAHLKEHVFDLCLQYMRAVGFNMPAVKPAWLKKASPLFDNYGTENKKGFLLYTGAGQEHKRMPVSFWLSLAMSLKKETGEPLTILAGVSEEEKRIANQLSEELAFRKIRHGFKKTTTLSDVCFTVLEHNVVISCDTYLVHLCSALGAPVVGLYPSTSKRVYGPYFKPNFAVESRYYSRCTLKNTLGNCDAWELGCEAKPCRLEMPQHTVIEAAVNLLEDELAVVE